MEILVKDKTLAQAYHKALTELSLNGEIVDCADWNTTCKDLSMTMVVEEPLAEPMISKLFIGGQKELQQYLMEMLDGILDFEIEKGNWEYTYHDRMVRYDKFEELGFSGHNQIQFVIDELKRNPSSRRAVILIRDGNDIGSDDPACLQHIQFFIRNNKLEAKVLFRSNDACKATFMNAFALIKLQERIANELNISVGTYTHRANSFHCYEKDFNMLQGYVNRINNDVNICYNYEEEWKEDMEDYIDEILQTVEKLKNN